MSQDIHGIDIQTYISVTLGGLLTISEIFPFIQKIESNGIVDLLMKVGSKYLDRMKNGNTTRSELERLIGDENADNNDTDALNEHNNKNNNNNNKNNNNKNNNDNNDNNDNKDNKDNVKINYNNEQSRVLYELNDIRDSLNEIKSCIVNIKTI